MAPVAYPCGPSPPFSTDVGELMLLVFTQDGVPTREISGSAKAGNVTALPALSRRQGQPLSSKQRRSPQSGGQRHTARPRSVTSVTDTVDNVSICDLQNFHA